MGIIDEIGESTIRLIYKTIYYTLGFLIALIKGLRKIDFKLYSFFEKKNIDFKDYIIFKLQMASLIFLILTVGYIFNYIHVKIMFFGLLILILIYLTYSISSLKNYCDEDFNAYKDFFLSYMLIPIIFIIVKNVKPVINFRFPYAHYVILSIVYVLFFSYYFRKKYARDFTYGKVVEDGEIIKVKVGYDIRANVKPKILNFANTINAKKGDVVKLRVEKGTFSIRGSKIVGVEEICKRENY